MSKTDFRINETGRLSSKLLPLLVVIITFVTYFVSYEVFISLAQTNDGKDKKFTQSSWKNEPVELIEIKNSSKSFKLNEEVDQEGDWLAGLSLSFKNKGTKRLKYLEVSLDFPETQKTGNMLVFPLTFGKNPADKRYSVPEEFVEADKEVSVSLDQKQHKRLKSFLESRQKIGELSEIQIRVIKILYDDETGWNLGNFIRMEPGNPIPVIIQNPREQGGQ